MNFITMKRILFLSITALILACSQQPKTEEPVKNVLVNSQVENLNWVEDAVIYEVNIRQFTPEGTFNAFSSHISRLKTLGVDVLWLMPIHPIGEKNRKGTMGSYYSVKDYKAVNPEFGTMGDLKMLVEQAHLQGMYVIIDWVANHTSWDNVWIEEHPDWYAKDSTGNMYYPADWTDVVQLDYDVPELHDGMIDAMQYWIDEADIDGFRCDVAGMVPVEFWNKARTTFDEGKPVFMLAEDEKTYELVEKAFDMNYAWHLHHIMNQIAKGEADAVTLKDYFAQYDSIFSKGVIRMNFITNHDENSWNGTVFERFGDGMKTFAVMSFTVPGMPLIYSGQEAGLNKRLDFFEKDAIDWTNEEYVEFYQTLITLKKEYEVFWNGADGGSMEVLATDNDSVFVFNRSKGNDDIFVLLNLSEAENTLTIPEGFAGAYEEYFTEETEILNAGEELVLEPWQYNVYIAK